MLDYLIKVLFFQTLFLAVYDFILKRETFFQYNRAYLIGTSILAYLLPLIQIKRVQNFVPDAYQPYFSTMPEIVVSPSLLIRGQFSWSAFLLNGTKVVLIAGAILATLLFLIRLYKIRKTINANPLERRKGFDLVWLKQTEAYSFFTYIFIGAQIPTASHDQIIRHEKVHVKQRHSLDLLFFEFQKIVAWFNPLSYIYQRRIAELHEFIADEKAVKYHDKATYFNQLLSHSFGIDNYSFVNPFFKHSLIKKRIIMLNKKKSNQLRKLKYMIVIPVLGGMLLYSSCTSQNDIIDPNQNETIEEVVVGDEFQKSDAATILFAIIEESPIFPGTPDGTNAENRSFLQNSIRMHVNKKFNLSGVDTLGLNPGKSRVHVQFTISDTGEIKDVRARAAHPALEKEAMRVVNSLPLMTPGKQRGITVNVKYTLPITLQIGASNESSSDSNEVNERKNTKEAPREMIIERNVNNNPAQDGRQVPFATIDIAPVFPGCTGSKAEQRKCLQDEIIKHINKKYNAGLAKELGLSPGKQRVHIQFLIDKTGNVTNIVARGPHKTLEDEAVRVVNSLPKMIPGKQRGQAVGVKYTVPVVLMVAE